MARATRNVQCRHIVITDNNCETTTNITQEIVNVDVKSVGLLGPQGPQGPEGPLNPSATTAQTASAVTIETEDSFDYPTSFILGLIPNTSTNESSIKKPPGSTAITYHSTTHPIQGGNDKSKEIRLGGNSQAGAINFLSSPTYPSYIKTFNSDLYLFPKNKLHLTGSEIIIDNLPTTDPGETGQLYTTGSDLFGGPVGLKVLMVS